ncbi:MAG TPA: YidC/Oxa1 family membrane protein insertase [Ktedonobacteraceae bacterium]
MGEIGYFFNIIFTFPIFNVLMLLDRVFGDFGLSIIVLTLVVRLCLFPLTLKQLRSTKATQAIQPLMADIRKKYTDPREQSAEMQRLYKEYGINPLAGCLPLLVQLPILYGMYGAMRQVLTNGTIKLADINNLIYPFLPKFQAVPDFNLRWFTFINAGWHISLAQPDPTHILPVLAALATFVQLRMSQARAAQQRATSGAAKSSQSDMMTQQMQIMSFIMPIVTGFIAWSFPAGLALYWTTTSVFSMVQQYFVTGWGSLFSLPSFLGGTSADKPKEDLKASTSETRRERASIDRVVDSSAEVVNEKNTRPAGTGYSGSNGSSTRRRRPQSASARRRGNVPKRNASRS